MSFQQLAASCRKERMAFHGTTILAVRKGFESTASYGAGKQAPVTEPAPVDKAPAEKAEKAPAVKPPAGKAPAAKPRAGAE